MLLPRLVRLLPGWVAKTVWAMDGLVLSGSTVGLRGFSDTALHLHNEQCGDTADFCHRGLPLC